MPDMNKVHSSSVWFWVWHSEARIEHCGESSELRRRWPIELCTVTIYYISFDMYLLWCICLDIFTLEGGGVTIKEVLRTYVHTSYPAAMIHCHSHPTKSGICRGKTAPFQLAVPASAQLKPPSYWIVILYICMSSGQRTKNTWFSGAEGLVTPFLWELGSSSG